MNGDMFARQMTGRRIQQSALAGTLGAASALQRELAPETLGELSSALEQLQQATAELHQEHEQLLMLRAVEVEFRTYVRQQEAIATMGQRALIDTDSELHQGTTFRIYLPRAAAEADPQPEHSDEDAVPRGMETILLDEDEPVVRALAARTLSEHGYAVLEATNGAEALRVAEQ